MGNLLREIFDGTDESSRYMKQKASELTKQSLKEHSCYTCMYHEDKYCAYPNETRVGCSIDKMVGIEIARYCKYYKQMKEVEK